MTTARVRSVLSAAAVTLTVTLALAGCGKSDEPASSGSSTKSSPSSTSSGDSSASTSDGVLVTIDKYGFSYRVPKGWKSIDGSDLLKPDNPVVKDMADKLGTTPEQLISQVGDSMQAYSITGDGAVGGVLANVNTIAQAGGDLSEAQLTVQLSSVGAKTGKVTTAKTPAGTLTRIPYTLSSGTLNATGVAMAIDLGDDTAVITVTAPDAKTAVSIADFVQGSVAKL